MMEGLSSKEVLQSRELHGSNKLPEPKLNKWYDFAKEALSEKNYNDSYCNCSITVGFLVLWELWIWQILL